MGRAAPASSPPGFVDPRILGLIIGLAIWVLAVPCWTQDGPNPASDLDAALEDVRTGIEQARYAEVLPLAERILEAVEAMGAHGTERHLEALDLLAQVRLHLGLFAEVEDLFVEAIRLREESLSRLRREASFEEIRALGDSYVGLALSIGARLRFEEMFELLWRGVHAHRRLGEYSRAEAELLTVLYRLYVTSDRDLEAEKVKGELEALLRQENEPLEEGLGESGDEQSWPFTDLDDPDFAAMSEWWMEWLEDAAEEDDDFVAAARLHKAQLAVSQELAGERDRAVATVRELLAELDKAAGAELEHAQVQSQLAGLLLDGKAARPEEALELYGGALETLETHLGEHHYDLTYSLHGLGRALQALGRFEEAERAYKRCLRLRRRHLEIEHPFVAHSLGKLAFLYAAAGRPRDDYAGMLGAAYGIYQRSFAHYPDLMKRWTLARFDYEKDEDTRHAEVMDRGSRHTLRALEEHHGPDHPAVANHLEANIFGLRIEGRHTEVEAHLRRIIEIRRRSFGDGHPQVVHSLHELALSLQLRGRSEQSLSIAAQASDLRRDHLQCMGYRRGEDIWRLQRGAGREFRTHLRALSDVMLSGDGGSVEGQRHRAFEVSQLAVGSRSAFAIARLAARLGEGKVARLARRHQDVVREHEILGEELVKELAHPSEGLGAVERLTRRRGELEVRLARLGAELRRLSPEYAELAFPRPIPLAEVQQKLLRPGEAMVLFVTEQNVGYMVPRKSTFVWWISRGEARFHRSPLGGDDLDAAVRTLREQIDPGGGRGGRLLGQSPQLAYDFTVAYRIYEALLEPFEGSFEGIEHLFIVPDGPLDSLPLGVLVEQVPAAETPLESAPWLADRFAMSILPSVASLSLLRARPPAPGRTIRFLGVGAPSLGGAWEEGAFGHLETAQADGKALSGADLRALGPLPESEEELRRLAAALDPVGTSKPKLLLHEEATEAAFRALDLDRFSVLSFATHGLMAGEFGGLSEPALVLTPPRRPTRSEDDGLLTASEIASLDLRADWIVLSACNTAASDGTPNADGLSGLARAFFYAGSRTLLVSHWYVLSQAAVELNIHLFERLAAEPSLPRAEALRRAMIAVRSSGDPASTHPRYWAPFVLVGDGA